VSSSVVGVSFWSETTGVGAADGDEQDIIAELVWLADQADGEIQTVYDLITGADGDGDISPPALEDRDFIVVWICDEEASRSLDFRSAIVHYNARKRDAWHDEHRD
jgi:hypothetical protein